MHTCRWHLKQCCKGHMYNVQMTPADSAKDIQTVYTSPLLIKRHNSESAVEATMSVVASKLTHYCASWWKGVIARSGKRSGFKVRFIKWNHINILSWYYTTRVGPFSKHFLTVHQFEEFIIKSTSEKIHLLSTQSSMKFEDASLLFVLARERKYMYEALTLKCRRWCRNSLGD